MLARKCRRTRHCQRPVNAVTFATFYFINMATMASAAITITYGLVAASLIALWFPAIAINRRVSTPPWALLFAAACTSGMLTGLVAPQAVAVLLAFAGLCHAARRCKAGVLKIFLMIAVGAMTLLLSLHRFPGFVNPPLVVDMQLSALSPAFTHRLNFDTSAAGLILFAYFCIPARSTKEWAAVARQYPAILGTAITVLALGAAAGFVGVDLKFSGYTLVFFACNLLFTCITEEAFFRGFVQEKLALAMQRWRAGPYLALLIASILFGVAHMRGGPALIVLASIAGFGYGYAYLRSKRIEAAILAHITLNTLHFIAFTYPRAL